LHSTQEVLVAQKQASRALELLARRFSKWRQGSSARKAIPAELWESAVSLAGDLGVYPVAKHLRLDYAKLKKLTEVPRTGSALTRAACVEAQFVEVALSPVQPVLPCRFEVRSPSGAKLRVATNVSAPTLAHILRDFGA
jgi:hypothetical protein